MNNREPYSTVDTDTLKKPGRIAGWLQKQGAPDAMPSALWIVPVTAAWVWAIWYFGLTEYLKSLW